MYAKEYLIKEKFSIEKLMMQLDKDQLENLEEKFLEHTGGITLEEFCRLMRECTPHKEPEKYDLIYGLIKLFKEIDINGDERLEWTEFTQYIIDEVMQNSSQIKVNGKEQKTDPFEGDKFNRYTQSQFRY